MTVVETAARPHRNAAPADAASATLPCGDGNDATVRHQIWRRFEGDDWAAYEALPASIRRRLREHAYDAWSVNALMLWQRYRRLHPTAERAERALLRYLDFCERLERRAYARIFSRRYGMPLPQAAARGPARRSGGAAPPWPYAGGGGTGPPAGDARRPRRRAGGCHEPAKPFSCVASERKHVLSPKKEPKNFCK